MIKDNILLVGCGKMGGALLSGLIAKVASREQILVINPSDTAAKKFGVRGIKNAATMPDDFKVDMVIFAVKPQILEALLPDFVGIGSENTVFVSIAAGKKLAAFEKYLSANANIVRAMPNLPAIVGQGATVVCANKNINKSHKERVDSLFKSVGEIFWIEDESLMDAVTAISGSGPAYVFYFMECLIKSAIALGLPEKLAVMLANSTVRGSAELAHNSDKSITELKEQVISPKGTTEAGLKVLADSYKGLEQLMLETTAAACGRSKELG
jgi:pyrroline-5-carboxylate reductase